MPDRSITRDTRLLTVAVDKKIIEKRVNALIKKAEQKALDEIWGDGLAKKRIKRAIANRFKPYILEAEIIAAQLSTEEYKNFREETSNFLAALVNVVACPDGRINLLSLTDPSVASVYRVPRGQLPTRLSTGKRQVPIPANTQLRATIWTKLKRLQKKTGKIQRLVNLMGPHINSADPIHGCGGAAEDLSGEGSGMPAVLATSHFAGAHNYFRILQASGEFWSVDNFVAIAGCVGTTVDYTHDLYSQGVIIGLGQSWRYLKKSKQFRQNLLQLHKDKKLVMSEILVKSYKKAIIKEAGKIDPRLTKGKLVDYRHPSHFAYNAMLIGKIAQQLTSKETKNGYKLLPSYMINKFDETALRVVTYHLLRNVAYLVLGNITPGKHWLIHHPEQLLRVGPIGADFNVKTIAFIETTPPTFSVLDTRTAFVLYRLMEKFLPSQDVDLQKEARIIMVTAGFNHSIYASDEATDAEYDKVKTQVIDNAAHLKISVKRAVLEGATVVIPMVHHSGNRSVIDVV